MQKSKITISWRQARFFLAYSLLLILAGLGLIIFSTWGGFIGAVLMFIGLAVFLAKVIRGSGQALCPRCGARIGDLQRQGTNPAVLCLQCGQYCKAHGALLSAIDAEQIAETALFATTLPDQFQWPPGCAVCGQAVGQSETVSLIQVDLLKTLGRSAMLNVLSTAAGMTAISLSTNEAKVDVPHCSQHKAGAKLQVPVQGGGLEIVFRSWPYQRAFCQLNNTVAKPLAHQHTSQGPLGRFVPKI